MDCSPTGLLIGGLQPARVCWPSRDLSARRLARGIFAGFDPKNIPSRAPDGACVERGKASVGVDSRLRVRAAGRRDALQPVNRERELGLDRRETG